MIPKRKRPPRLSGGGLGGSKTEEDPSPPRRGPRWSQSGGGPLASAAGASVVPKRKRPPRLSGGSLGDPKAKEAPSSQRRGPRWSQSERSPLVSAGGASVIPVCPQSPLGRPYPSTAQAGPEGLGCNRRCVGEGPHRVPTIPHGVSLSLRGQGRTGGTRVQPPLCGGGTSPCAHNSPRGVPIPPRPRQDRRDSGATAAVLGRDLTVYPQSPTGCPYPSAAKAGPEGLGCNRRCVGEGPHRVPIIPHGASLSLRGPGRTGGTRVQPPLCGGGTSPCAHNPPRGVPIPPRPRQDRRDSGATAAVWGRDLTVCP